MNITVPNSKVIDLNYMSNTSIDNIIELYRQGYRISNATFNAYNNITPRVLSTLPRISALSTCPAEIQQGTSKTITITPSSGTPPYTLDFLVDGTTKQSFPNITTSQTLTYTFNESIGTHNYQVKVTDSCTTPGPQTGTDSCSISITTTAPVKKCNPGEISVADQCYNLTYVAAGGAGLLILLMLLK